MSGDEGVIPRWVLEKDVKVIPWDDSVPPEKTAAEAAEYFGLIKQGGNL